MKILLKLHKKIEKHILPISIGLVLISTLLFVFISPKDPYNWPTDKNKITIPFTTDTNGYMYIRASIGDTSGLFFIDTGADLTCIKESLLANKDSSYSKKLTDAQLISDRKEMIWVSDFKIDELRIPLLKVWPTDGESWGNKGTFYNKDNVIGIIGNSILSQFVWEFNMEKREITISKELNNNVDMPDSLAIPLMKKGKGYHVEIEINGKTFHPTFDSGCSSPLVLKDTFSDSLSVFTAVGFGKRNMTFFSHLKNDSLQNDSSFYCLIPSIKLGKDTMQSIICMEKSKVNLLGIPFFWSYKKVIADYPSQKVYFKNPKSTEFSVGSNFQNFIQNSFLAKRGTCRVKADSTKIFVHKIEYHSSTESDTVESFYTLYNNWKYWGSNMSNLDSIICADSVKLPNGKIIKGRYKIDPKNKYFIDN